MFLLACIALVLDAAPLTIRAADMSALAVEDCAMTCNQFRASATAPSSDALLILRSADFNTIRLRVWVNPSSNHSEGSVAYVIALATRVHAAGLAVWLDFHLSDWWADPGHQVLYYPTLVLCYPTLEPMQDTFDTCRTSLRPGQDWSSLTWYSSSPFSCYAFDIA